MSYGANRTGGSVRPWGLSGIAREMREAADHSCARAKPRYDRRVRRSGKSALGRPIHASGPSFRQDHARRLSGIYCRRTREPLMQSVAIFREDYTWSTTKVAISSAISSIVKVAVFLATLSARLGLKSITSRFVISCQIGRITCSPSTLRLTIPSSS